MKLEANVLLRLSAQALQSYLGCAPGFEVHARPGQWMVLTGEPVADLNYIIVAAESGDASSCFESWVAACDGRDLPFVAMLGPAVADDLSSACKTLGLVHAVSWPLMTCPADRVEARPLPDLEIGRVETDADIEQMADVLAQSFGMLEDSIRRAVPLRACALPGLEIHLGRIDGAAVSTVAVTRHDRVAGIFAMGTLPDTQGRGIGRALLSTVMAEHRDRGAEVFFLGATPAGLALYERLGYEIVAEAQAWIRGETGQA